MVFLDTTMDKKYVVYQHVTPDGLYYFGATNNIKRRWRNNGAEYKGTALQPYIEQYGWDNIQHIVLFRDQTKENALWIEDFLITTAREDGVCINKNRSGNISKEEDYYRDYEQKRSKKRRGYQREYYREYREKNKEKIQERKKQYYEKNREKELEQSRQRYQRKKEEQQLKELGCLPLW